MKDMEVRQRSLEIATMLVGCESEEGRAHEDD